MVWGMVVVWSDLYIYKKKLCERFVLLEKIENGLYFKDSVVFWVLCVGLRCGEVLCFVCKILVKFVVLVFEWKKKEKVIDR